jgi:hypothetical protein
MSGIDPILSLDDEATSVNEAKKKTIFCVFCVLSG